MSKRNKQGNESAKQKKLESFFGKENIQRKIAIFETRLLELNVVIALDMENANGLDFIFPGANSSSSSSAGPSNRSSNIDIAVRAAGNQAVITSTQTTASTSTSLTTSSARINVSVSLNRKCMQWAKIPFENS